MIASWLLVTFWPNGKNDRPESSPEFSYVITGTFSAIPLNSTAVDRAWLTWRDGTVAKLAQTIYDDRRFDLLPILADALQEAGCADSEILQHCHAPGPHVRGCWVVDLLLGKA